MPISVRLKPAIESLLAGRDQVAQHRSARQGMQGLGPGGTHPRAEPGGEKDGGGCHALGGTASPRAGASTDIDTSFFAM